MFQTLPKRTLSGSGKRILLQSRLRSRSFRVTHLGSDQVCWRHLLSLLLRAREANPVFHVSFCFPLTHCPEMHSGLQPYPMKRLPIQSETQSCLVPTRQRRHKGDLFSLIRWEKTCRGQFSAENKKSFLSGSV